MYVRKEITIIALLGSSAAGKTTAAQHLVQKHGFKRMSFADPFKDMLRALGLSSEQLNGPQAVRNQPCDLLVGKSPRYAMQTLGSGWRDMIDRRLWSNITKARIIQALQDGETRIVIDDLRFHHEIEMLYSIGAMSVAIRRPEVEPSLFARVISRLGLPSFFVSYLKSKGLPFLHDSEVDWFQIKPDYTVQNTGSLSDVHREIDGFIAKEL